MKLSGEDTIGNRDKLDKTCTSSYLSATNAWALSENQA